MVMNTEMTHANLRSLSMAEPSEPLTEPVKPAAPAAGAPEVVPASKPSPKVSFLTQSWQLLVFAVFAIGVYLFISRCVFQSVQVVGASMLPTLHDADHYFLNRWAY